MKQALPVFLLLLVSISAAQTISNQTAAEYGKEVTLVLLPAKEDSRAVTLEKCGKLAGILIDQHHANENFSQVPNDVLIALRSNVQCSSLALSDRDVDRLFDAMAIQFDATNELLRRISEISETRRRNYEELLEQFRKQEIVRSIVPNTTGGCTPAIETQTDDDFNGWDDQVIYKMANGQIWQQSNYHYHYHYAYRPNVTIYATTHGCHIKVEGDDDEGVDAVRLK